MNLKSISSKNATFTVQKNNPSESASVIRKQPPKNDGDSEPGII